MANTKVCRICKKEKPISEFPLHARAKNGIGHLCQDCKHKSYLPWNRKNTISRSVYIYVLQAENGLVKIGISSNAESRIRGIQTQSPVPISIVLIAHNAKAVLLESIIHERFRKLHSHGEWFNLSESDIDEIRRIIHDEKS